MSWPAANTNMCNRRVCKTDPRTMCYHPCRRRRSQSGIYPRFRRGGAMAEHEVLRLVQRRGMHEFKEIDREDLVLPRTADRQVKDSYYHLLLKYSFRLVLRDIIKHQDAFEIADLTRYCTREVAQDYVDFLNSARIVLPLDEAHYRMAKRPIRSFGITLEWLIAEVLKREFGADVLWGIRFSGTTHGGDYDVVAAMEGILVYVEIKSSPPKHIEQGEITGFLKRTGDLLPHIAIFFEDTELRMNCLLYTSDAADE